MAQHLIIKDYQLTTAEILYHLPDYPTLLQCYIWQNLDIAPKFPALHHFLEFWQKELEGKLHSVKIASAKLVAPAEITFVKAQLTLH